MIGLDKMVQEILNEANSAAASSLSAAQLQSQATMADAKEQGIARSADIAAQSAMDTADYLSRAQSAAELQKRKNILVAKQQIIQDMIERAKQSLYSATPEQYFALVLKMASKYTLPQAGEIIFSKKDLARLPAQFEPALNEAVQAKGAVLRISGETREIDGGFVLVYGDIEENCSFSALLEADHDILQDQVHELLFT